MNYSQHATKWSMEDDKQTLHDAVREAADIAMSFFQSEDLESWDKSKNNPVTEADIAVNKHLQKKLTRNRPEYGWLSEETEDTMDRRTCERVWVVDPIDGTRAFMNGTTDWGISVALIHLKKPVLAAFYAPALDAFYEAEAGKGAFKNGEPIQVSETNSIAIATMMGHDIAFKNSSVWPIPWPESMNYIRNNSVALRLAKVADGSADCCISLRQKCEWDIAAADLIVREAGGLVTNGYGKTFGYNQEKPICTHVVASNRNLYSDILSTSKPALERWKAAQKAEKKGK